MLKDQEVTRTVTLTDLTAGEPPTIVTSEQLRRPDGTTRHFAQVVPVPDPDLFRRLRAEVRSGDEIEITTLTEWTKPGSPMRLVAFCVCR